MNLGIVTVVHSGYSKYLIGWCKHIAKLEVQPEVTVVLGYKHKASDKILRICKTILPQIRFISARGKNLGRLRNIAISKTHTEWVMVLDVDDEILPDAMVELDKASVDSDFILLLWNERRGERTTTKIQMSPVEAVRKNHGKTFFHNANPFRRSFWVEKQFDHNDYPGALFVVGLVEAGARITRVQNPCVVHVRHQDSFSYRTRSNEKRKFVAEKLQKRSARRLVLYYGATDEPGDSNDSL